MIAVVHPGQGAQRPGMLDHLRDDAIGRRTAAEAAEALGYDLVDRCRDPEALKLTSVAQPAVVVAGVAAARSLTEPQPIATAGHSVGEFAALVTAGATTLVAALLAVSARADAMAAIVDERPGAMLAIAKLTVAEVTAVRDEVVDGDVLVLANFNGADQTVLAGDTAAIDRAAAVARSRGGIAIQLKVAGAFHSPLMDPARPSVDAAIDGMEITTARLPVVQNATALPTVDADELRAALHAHLTSPVRWVETMDALAALGAGAVVEAGPGTTLTALTRRGWPALVPV